MPELINPFDTDAFALTTLTDAFNTVPYQPGYLSAQGLFAEQGVSTLSIVIEEKNGVLSLIQTQPRNGPRTGRERERRKLRTLSSVHLPVYDYIRADELQGVRAFGSPDQALAVETVRNDRLGSMANDLDYTLEYHRLGAVQGIILDADGEVILNIFDFFEVAQPTEVDLDLDAANPAEGALLKKIAPIKRAIINAMTGVPFAGIECLCGDNFFDLLVNHPDARELYRRAQQNRLGDAPVYESFVFGGIKWTNYRGSGEVAINTDKCKFYPTGAKGLFKTYYSPAPYFDTVNTIGLPRYAKGKVNDDNTQIDLTGQTNPTTFCHRPLALIGGRKT